MHIEMLIVDEEAFAYSGVTVFEGLDVELDLIWQQGRFVGSNDLPTISEDSALVPIFILL